MGPSQRDSNPQGCGAEETRSVFQRSTRGPQARSESGRRQPHADIPHRPPLNCLASSDGGLSFLCPTHGIRTRKGAELRKREAFSSVAREGRRPEARAGGASRTRTSLIAHHLIEKAPSDGGLSFLGPSQRDSNPQGCGAEETRKRFPAQHARAAGPKRKRAAKWTLGEYPCAKNAKYEYCYLFGSSVFEVIKGKSDIRTTTDSPVKPI